MSTAWVEQPPVPSFDEEISIKKEIVMLEKIIADEWRIIHRAQARLAILTEILEEKKVLLAPIKKLNFDVLSMIFVFCSWIDPTASLRIGHVSRYWRSIILCTPQAWCFIHSARIFRSYHKIYLERSGQQLLHINLSDMVGTPFLTMVAHRTQCLSIAELPFCDMEKMIVFPRLTRLIISGRNQWSCPDLSTVTTSHFPNLRHLEINTMLETFGICPRLPPLQTLRIFPRDEDGWPAVVKACNTSLKSLEIIIDRVPLEWRVKRAALPVDFPSLLYLKIVYRDIMDAHPWWLRWKTPALETFIEEARYIVFEHRASMNSPESVATYIRLLRSPFFSGPRNFRVLQLYLTLQDLNHFLDVLATNGSNCAKLQWLEFGLSTMNHTDREKARSILQEWDRTGLSASARVVLAEDRMSVQLPGENELPVRCQILGLDQFTHFTQCGNGMPCMRSSE